MKRQFTTGLLAIAGAAAIFAGIGRIDLTGVLGKSIGRIWLDDTEKITYQKDDAAAGDYSQMTVREKDGTEKTYKLSSITKMTPVEALPESPLTVTITPHHYNLEYTVTTTEDDTWFTVFGCPKSKLAGVDKREWYMGYWVQFYEDVHAFADFWEKTVPEVDKNSILYHADGARTEWWDQDYQITPEMDMVFIVIPAKYTEDDIVIAAEPTVIEWRTKKLEVAQVDYTFTYDPAPTSNKVEVGVKSSDPTIPFAVAIFNKSEVDQNGIENTVRLHLATLEQLAYSNGSGGWPSLTNFGEGSARRSNIVVGDQFVVAAFGCEIGQLVTNIETFEITVPPVSPTNNATFDVTATRLSGAEMSLDVKPSDKSLRWIALIEEEPEFASTTTEMWIAKKLQFLTRMNAARWTTDTEHIQTGDAVISSHDNVFDGVYFDTKKEYRLMIFGVDEEGGRTTAVYTQTLSTKSGETTDEVTFDIKISDFDEDTQKYTATVTPSDNNVKYVMDNLSADNYSVKTDGRTDEKIMQDHIKVWGSYLPLYSGKQTRSFSISSAYDSVTQKWGPGKNRLMVFAYDGEILSKLYLLEIDGATGEVTVIRPE